MSPQPPETRDDPRRAALLDQLVDVLEERGLAGISLRPLASAIGVSTYSLKYWFGSKEELLVACAEHIEARQRAALSGALGPAGPEQTLLALWTRLADRPSLDRLVFELALQREHSLPAGFPARLLRAWVSWAESVLVRAGMDPARAAVEASLAAATLNGLLLDLSVTGDRARLDAAAAQWARACAARWA